MTGTPIPYDPSYEVAEKDEETTNRELAETVLKISRKVSDDSGHASRGVHMKSHGLLFAEMEVLPDLAGPYKQGIFAKPGKYPVVMRFSSPPGDLLSDAVSTPRALAIKIMDVPGDRLRGSEDATTQDFVMVNGPSFQNPSAKSFLRGLKMLGMTTDKFGKAKEFFSSAMQATEKVIEKVGGESGNIKLMGGQPPVHPLGESYFTQAPLLYGAYMAKVSVRPVSPDLTSLTGKEIDVKNDPLAMRHAISEHFDTKGGEWEICVQLCTDIEEMPIEDPSKEWPEHKSPYIAVARIKALPQISWSQEKSALVDDRMSFSPWHGVTDHRPIGAIMRVRKHAYEESVKFRAAQNGVDISEPGSTSAPVNTVAKAMGCPFHQ